MTLRRATFTGLILLAVALGVSGFIYLQGPSQSANYDVKILDKVGAPPGFIVDPKTQEVQSSSFGNLSARRAYNGNATFPEARDYMLEKLQDIGFRNAAWRDASGVEAAGILATCKDTAVFVRVDQSDDDPIDIQAWEAHYANAPTCPWL